MTLFTLSPQVLPGSTRARVSMFVCAPAALRATGALPVVPPLQAQAPLARHPATLPQYVTLRSHNIAKGYLPHEPYEPYEPSTEETSYTSGDPLAGLPVPERARN